MPNEGPAPEQLIELGTTGKARNNRISSFALIVSAAELQLLTRNAISAAVSCSPAHRSAFEQDLENADGI